MTPEVIQGLIVGGLLSTAGVLLRTVVKLAELGRDHVALDKRVEKIEERL